jgi:murein DD-endopeptidase MepM/ murein hydrolase activator NlpD
MMRRVVVSAAVGLAVVLAGPVAASGPGAVDAGRFAGLPYVVVRSGDTLAAISQRTGVPRATIVEANGLVDDRIYAGARLLLSHPNPMTPRSGTPGADPAGTSYTVRAGDTLSGIAVDHRSSISAIVGANSIADPDRIRVGATLVIPSAAGAPGGSMRCPVAGARFSYDWGFPRSGGRFHEGADLLAPVGTAIVAPRAGRLTFGENPLGGRVFHLVDADGTTWYGAHLSSTVGADRTVEAGETIGTVGTSGNAAGGPAHLHLEMDPSGGYPVNPYPFLRQAC